MPSWYRFRWKRFRMVSLPLGNISLEMMPTRYTCVWLLGSETCHKARCRMPREGLPRLPRFETSAVLPETAANSDGVAVLADFFARPLHFLRTQSNAAEWVLESRGNASIRNDTKQRREPTR
jgi:hypothetical protein